MSKMQCPKCNSETIEVSVIATIREKKTKKERKNLFPHALYCRRYGILYPDEEREAAS